MSDYEEDELRPRPCRLHVSEESVAESSNELPESSFCLLFPWSMIHDDIPVQFLLPLTCIFSGFILAVCWREEGVSPQV